VRNLTFVHESAVIDEGAKIGRGTKIWHFCHVMKGAKIGTDCVLGQGVFVADGAVIGDGVRIQNNVSVYDGCVLEDDVFIGPSAVLTNQSKPRAAIARNTLHRGVHVKLGATIGANATILPGLTIGYHAFIGAGAVVTRNVIDYALMVGTPANRVGWIGRNGQRLIQNPRIQCEYHCPESGLKYVVLDDVNRRLCCVDVPERTRLERIRRG
jgi:UDP-2-acetamido-3-amino-2,3-dideoxy-glucuronate N-acetyltransferase